MTTITPEQLLELCAEARCPACEWTAHIDVDIDAFDMPPQPEHADDCGRHPAASFRAQVRMFEKATFRTLNVTWMPPGEKAN